MNRTTRRQNADHMMDSFLSPVLSLDHMDRFVSRKGILDSLLKYVAAFRGIVLDLGCGNMPYRELILKQAPRVTGYVGVDIHGARYRPPDVYWDGKSIPFGDGAIDTVIATEVLEHCPDPGRVLAEVARVLKPGGIFFMTVPFLWPLHDIPHDEYRYTPYVLQRLLQDAGLDHIEIRALGGWDASLAQMIGLWMLRRPMSRWKRAIASRIALCVMRWLLARDRIPSSEEAAMITGLSAVAYKPSLQGQGIAPDKTSQGGGSTPDA